MEDSDGPMSPSMPVQTRGHLVGFLKADDGVGIHRHQRTSHNPDGGAWRNALVLVDQLNLPHP